MKFIIITIENNIISTNELVIKIIHTQYNNYTDVLCIQIAINRTQTTLERVVSTKTLLRP